ncbi:MAG TPA: L-rhamnose/proton symporter RhaT [Verrucomicrobiae bacterium]|nr:L-rhamnose/proton symporter RhaT [Verrucomicrobiae bacterium]
MNLFLGFLLVLAAGLLQGTFILPMTLVKEWSWKHTWAAFSLFGMLVFNWIITLVFIPDIFTVYGSSPSHDLALLALFGMGWGVGAVLFGLGMDRLGMALGYPIIMGLIASLGALIPLLVFFPQTLLTRRGALLLAGTGLVVFGIVLSSVGGSRRAASTTKSDSVQAGAFAAGLTIAILAGILSCLPNVGMAFGKNVVAAAGKFGISRLSAGNSVWALLFTFGFLVNFAYCLYLMISRRTLRHYWNRESPRNLGWSAIMALMWIGSFYLYGAGATRLGRWGVVAGWPLFITLSIVVGYLWGLWRGEWQGAPIAARRLLNSGLVVLIIAVVAVALSNFY